MRFMRTLSASISRLYRVRFRTPTGASLKCRQVCDKADKLCDEAIDALHWPIN